VRRDSRGRLSVRLLALVALRTIWLDLLVCDIARSSVVVKAESPERIVAFGIAAAMERRPFDVLKAGCEPFVARRMVHEWCAGAKPFLNEQQYANANAGDGVNVFAFPLGVNVDAVDTSDEETARTIFVALMQAFGKQHAGLNVSTFAQELFGWFPKLSRDAEPARRWTWRQMFQIPNQVRRTRSDPSRAACGVRRAARGVRSCSSREDTANAVSVRLARKVASCDGEWRSHRRPEPRCP